MYRPHRRTPSSPITTSVHAGRHDFRSLGCHAAPIDLSTTYPFNDAAEATEALDALVSGDAEAGNPIYARLYNPTVARVERAVAEIEGAEACVAFSSGMAAITACILAASERGRHVVGVRPIYGTTDHLLSSGLLGVETTWTGPNGVSNAIRRDTGLVVLETPANPTLDLVDIAEVVRAAHGVPVMVDSTFATPILQQPLFHGATYSLHSATKFLSGHGDTMGGLICTSEAAAARLRQVRVATGALLHPMAAYLLLRSLPTLPMRVHQAQASAIEIAERLQAHRSVADVLYPGLSTCDPSGIVGRQMAGPGAVLSFRLRPPARHATSITRAGDVPSDLYQAFFNELSMITPAVSLGSTDTLIQQPAALTHRILEGDVQDEHGITPDLFRLSVGIEDVEDIWADLSRGLEVFARRCEPSRRPLTLAPVMA